ncbi:MAG: glycosyltransferase [bacterium]
MQRMRKKTILYIITQSEWGGAQRYVFDMAYALRDSWHVCVAGGEQGDDGILAQRLKESNIPFYSVSYLVRRISFINDIRAFFQMISLLRKVRPDVVHLNSSKVSVIGSCSCFFVRFFLRIRIKVVYTAHGWVFCEPLSLWKKFFYWALERKTSFFKDKVICVSHNDYFISRRRHVVSKKKLTTVLNGIGVISFLSKAVARKNIEHYGVPNGYGLYIGSIGNLYRTKGFSYLIEAVRRYKKQCETKIVVCIIGEGEERSLLQQKIRDAHLQDTIFLIGSVPDAAQLLRAFDIYVCSSVKEGLSYTLIEALQAGIPIIATDVGGNKEILDGGKAGMLVSSQKAEDIAHAIAYMASNKEEGERYAIQAQVRAAYFTIDRMVQETVLVYERLLQ